jgi:hypothetical protein
MLAIKVIPGYTRWQNRGFNGPEFAPKRIWFILLEQKQYLNEQ